MTEPGRVNETLGEIHDPQTRAKLEGIQECVWSMDEQIIQVRASIAAKKASASAVREFGKKVFDQCDVINKLVHANQMEPAEAKLRISEINKVKQMADAHATEQQVDAYKLEGKVAGLAHAAEVSSKKFDEHVAKYERWQRIKAEEVLRHAEAAEVAEPAKKQAKDGQASKAKPAAKKAAKKASKKVAKRKAAVK